MKETDLKEIWSVPKYLPYVQPELTDKIIEEAEAKIGYRFPKEYLDLLRTQNGGYIRVRLKDTTPYQISGIGQHYNSITDFEWFKEYEDGLDFKLDGLFPFDGDGHWNICLDYRNNKVEPQIIYVDTEMEFERLVAKSFREYLNMLEIDTENQFVIETELTIQDFLNKISDLLDIKFQAPTRFDYGYDIYRGNYKESIIFISPNKVPDGFVRENDARYEELKSSIIKEALRYPEIPENCLFIETNNDKEQSIFKILEQNGIMVKELKTYFEKNPNN